MSLHMRALALVLSLFPLPLAAYNVWFIPPNPTSRTPVVARIRAATACPANGADVSVIDHSVSITLKEFSPCAAPPPLDGFWWAVDLGVLPAGVYDVAATPDRRLGIFAEGTLIVQDASSPIEISPNVVPALSENELVTITGAGIAPVCAVAPCPVPQVLFGEKQAEVVRQVNTSTLVVRAPADYVGTVDVTIVSSGQTFRSIAGFHYSSSAGGDPAFFETIYFPVIINGPGAFGSEWSTDATLRNETDYPLTTATYDLFAVPCSPPCDPRPPAHSTRFGKGLDFADGYRMSVPRQAAEHLSFGLIVRDLSRQAETAGTEIPVVREKDLFDGSFTLLNVPSDPRYRVALRAFRNDSVISPVGFRIRPMQSEDQPLVDLRFEGGEVHIGDLLTRFPQLQGKGPLRIDVNGSWGFVSVTNNETQHVTIISPH